VKKSIRIALTLFVFFAHNQAEGMKNDQRPQLTMEGIQNLQNYCLSTLQKNPVMISPSSILDTIRQVRANKIFNNHNLHQTKEFQTLVSTMDLLEKRMNETIKFKNLFILAHVATCIAKVDQPKRKRTPPATQKMRFQPVKQPQRPRTRFWPIRNRDVYNLRNRQKK